MQTSSNVSIDGNQIKLTEVKEIPALHEFLGNECAIQDWVYDIRSDEYTTTVMQHYLDLNQIELAEGAERKDRFIAILKCVRKDLLADGIQSISFSYNGAGDESIDYTAEIGVSSFPDDSLEAIGASKKWGVVVNLFAYLFEDFFCDDGFENDEGGGGYGEWNIERHEITHKNWWNELIEREGEEQKELLY